jgi:Flp pilus assembly pilin Flp
MFRVFITLLSNEGGFTAVEYGIMIGLVVIAVEQLATKT